MSSWMGLEGFEAVAGAVAALVGGLRFEVAAVDGVGAVFLVVAVWPTGEVAVLWCRRRRCDDGDVRGVMVRGARKSRTGAWLRANVFGERSLGGMACDCWFWYNSE